MSALMEQIKQLSREEQRQLAQEIFQNLDETDADWPLSPEQEAAIDREIENFRRDGNPGASWEEARARIVAETSPVSAR